MRKKKQKKPLHDSIKNMIENIRQLRAKDGPYYRKWFELYLLGMQRYMEQQCREKSMLLSQVKQNNYAQDIRIAERN